MMLHKFIILVFSFLCLSCKTSLNHKLYDNGIVCTHNSIIELNKQLKERQQQYDSIYHQQLYDNKDLDKAIHLSLNIDSISSYKKFYLIYAHNDTLAYEIISLKKKDISITNNDLIKIGNKYNLSIINLFPEESIPGFGIIPKDVTRAYLLYDVYISFKPEFHYTIYEAINLDGLQLTY